MKLKKKVLNKPVEVLEPETPKFTDLRQVMDYSRPLSIFFSGVEYESYLDILYDLGVRNFLMSYEYLKGKGRGQLKKYPDMHLFIDSGAYTYQNDPKYEEYTIEQWEEQIRTYLKWAESHKDSIFAICDLDLQYVVGDEQVYEWRKKYFEPFMLRTGIPVCFMYHDEGMQQWEYMCKRYPYVGLSLAIDKTENGEAQLQEMFKIAEKHNALCQGMASTNTALLVKYPFYTVDSTTWNVGLKYGEISVWNGMKMSRIKKTDFETKAFPVIQQYDKDFDFDLIRAEDKTEMIRVNAYAFVQAEKVIRDKLKARMYWLKAKTVKVDINNLPDDFFPDPEWFDGDLSDLSEVCTRMNINPDYEGAYQLVYDVTVFLNWDNERYSEMKEEYLENDGQIITELHDLFVNRIVPDLDTKVEDLIKFYSACVSGEDDKLLQLGTNFDRMVKERDDYIEDEETELKDLTKEEINRRVFNFLPESAGSEAPEIDELDEEIFKKADIVPTFGKDGKFLKGQTRVRKPKKLYSDKYPKFACDTCYAAAKCPEYKAGYACAYNKMFNRFDTRNMTDIIEAMQGMVSHNLARMQRAMIIETMTGITDGNVTSFINQNMALLSNLQKMYESSSAEVLRQTRVVRSDGSEEHTTEITNPQSGGILEKLFSNISSEKEEPKNDKPQEDMVNTEAEESTQ